MPSRLPDGPRLRWFVFFSLSLYFCPVSVVTFQRRMFCSSESLDFTKNRRISRNQSQSPEFTKTSLPRTVRINCQINLGAIPIIVERGRGGCGEGVEAWAGRSQKSEEAKTNVGEDTASSTSPGKRGKENKGRGKGGERRRRRRKNRREARRVRWASKASNL